MALFCQCSLSALSLTRFLYKMGMKGAVGTVNGNSHTFQRNSSFVEASAPIHRPPSTQPSCVHPAPLHLLWPLHLINPLSVPLFALVREGRARPEGRERWASDQRLLSAHRRHQAFGLGAPPAGEEFLSMLAPKDEEEKTSWLNKELS